MANERLGQMSEVVFSIQEGSFYNCVMPGMVLLVLAGAVLRCKSDPDY